MNGHIYLFFLLIGSITTFIQCHKSTQNSFSHESDTEEALSKKDNPIVGYNIFENADISKLKEPVIVYQGGTKRGVIEKKIAEEIGLTIIDLSDDWAPFIFSEKEFEEEQPKSNLYRKVFVELANEQGEPVHIADPEHTKYYLEVYGIPPSLSTLKRRLIKELKNKDCFNSINYEILKQFQGSITYKDGKSDIKNAKEFWLLERNLKLIAKQLGVEKIENIPNAQKFTSLKPKERQKILKNIEYYNRVWIRYHALREGQKRLFCSNLFPGKGRYEKGAMDWPTHIALLNFERRNLIYGWGVFGNETLERLSLPIEEEYYLALKRIIEARVIDASGIIEDGSSFNNREPPSYIGKDKKIHKLRNLVQEFTEVTLKELGIETVEKGINFLLNTDTSKRLLIAVKLPPYPEYYSEFMELQAYIDRGDVWYDFFLDENGNEIPQPVKKKPEIYLFVRYLNQKIPLIRWKTTIGGWRSEYINGKEYWTYKESEVGPRVWRYIVAAPVWIPPDTTPPRELVRKVWKDGKLITEIDYPEMGPGYASAYGLVMGIHEEIKERKDGNIIYFDNGIRTHGSVDYMSIARRHSHGCHRLLNHLAIRLFTFVLKHRPYKRLGQIKVNYEREIEYKDKKYKIELKTRGYYYELTPPVDVYVAEGNIKGKRKKPIQEPIPKLIIEEEPLPKEAPPNGSNEKKIEFISPF